MERLTGGLELSSAVGIELGMDDGPSDVEAMVRYWAMLMDFQKVLPMARLSDQGSMLKMETSTTDPMKDSRLAMWLVTCKHNGFTCVHILAPSQFTTAASNRLGPFSLLPSFGPAHDRISRAESLVATLENQAHDSGENSESKSEKAMVGTGED